MDADIAAFTNTNTDKNLSLTDGWWSLDIQQLDGSWITIFRSDSKVSCKNVASNKIFRWSRVKRSLHFRLYDLKGCLQECGDLDERFLHARWKTPMLHWTKGSGLLRSGKAYVSKRIQLRSEWMNDWFLKDRSIMSTKDFMRARFNSKRHDLRKKKDGLRDEKR